MNTASERKPRTGPLVATGLLLSAFVAVYAPAFAIVGSMRLALAQAVPAVIALTFVAACALILLMARSNRMSVAEFGVRSSPTSYFLLAVMLGVPLSALAAWLLSRSPEPGPLAALHIAPWLTLIYFGLAAPVQEEVIFRGLLQTTFATKLGTVGSSPEASSQIAVVVAALLFAAIHLAVGPMTATCAVVLGIVAGELRRRSGSLLPPMLCHAIFNLPEVLKALSQ